MVRLFLKSLLLITILLSSSMHSMAGQNKIKQHIVVLEQARDLISESENWLRESNHKVCKADLEKMQYSLYCSLQKSQLKVLGKTKHRGLAMKTVRSIIQSKSKNEKYNHPIQEYNSMASRTHQDVLDILTIATAKLKSKLKFR